MGIGFMKRSMIPYATVTVTAQTGGSAFGGGQIYKEENRYGDSGGQQWVHIRRMVCWRSAAVRQFDVHVYCVGGYHIGSEV